MRVSFLASSLLVLSVVAHAQQPQSSPATPKQPPTLGPLHMKGSVPPNVDGAVPGVPAPTPAEAKTIGEVKAFEKACDDAAVRGDAAFLTKALADTFVMTHGDGWTTGEAPLKVDTKSSWIEYISKQPPPYFYRDLDSIQVELHGDVAITIGRYRYLPRPGNGTATTQAAVSAANGGTHLYVWFERVYAKRNGQWQFLSHRTVSGPGRELDTHDK